MRWMLALLLLVPSIAWADAKPIITVATSPDACVRVLLCDAQSASGVCTCAATDGQCTGPGTTDEIVYDFTGRNLVGFYATTSTATAFSVDLGTTDAASYDTAGDTPATIDDAMDENGDGSTNILWNGGRYRSLSLAPLDKAWGVLSGVSGGTVTVNLEVCPIGK